MIEITNKCARCYGTGLVQNHKCMNCGGTGILSYTKTFLSHDVLKEKDDTERLREDPDSSAKLATAAQDNKVFFSKHGFDENGIGYIITDTDTFAIKDEIKDLNGKFCGRLKEWIMPMQFDGHEYISISVDEIYEKDYVNHYVWNAFRVSTDEKYVALIERLKKAKTKDSKSSFLGNLKERKLFKAMFLQEHHYNTDFGTVHIYEFSVGDDLICWKTSKELELKENIKVFITGTVKEHMIYKNNNVTCLTRCKIMEVE